MKFLPSITILDQNGETTHQISLRHIESVSYNRKVKPPVTTINLASGDSIETHTPYHEILDTIVVLENTND